MFLKPQMHELLLRLDRARINGGSEWVSVRDLRDIPIHIRTYAQSRQWIVGEGDKSNRKYKILPTGRTKLAQNADANMAVMDQIENGYVPTGDEPINDLTIIEPAGIIKSLIAAPPVPLMDVPSTEQKNTQAAVAPLDEHARACVQAINILGEDFPEVNDLVDVLMRLNRRKANGHE